MTKVDDLMAVNLTLIKDRVQLAMKDDTTGHSFDHIQRVVNNAKMILASLPDANAAIVYAAAYMHDLADDKLVADPVARKVEMQELLLTAGYSEDEANAVMDIIEKLSFSANLHHHQKLTLEGQIVQDADRLDAIGAVGITRAIYYSGHHGEKIYDPAIKPRKHMTKEEYRRPGTTINHFYEKLLKLADEMNTEPAKQIAQHRNQVMKDYLAEFKAEWNGER
ncbi:HD domain-containing protein [Lentilactobacillus kribbianus]|uniref:HD domain-containing protein n=1 Tax=Lentilactobacillus kribbianus TaxID=2729622 RepID=UPI003CCD26E4